MQGHKVVGVLVGALLLGLTVFLLLAPSGLDAQEMGAFTAGSEFGPVTAALEEDTRDRIRERIEELGKKIRALNRRRDWMG